VATHAVTTIATVLVSFMAHKVATNFRGGQVRPRQSRGRHGRHKILPPRQRICDDHREP
jgi:hypothetical protein